MGDIFEIFEDDQEVSVDRFEVRDLRVKSRFSVDNVFYDDFTPVFGCTLSMVYIALVRHANKEQKSWPSQSYIAKQVGLSRKWVSIQLQILEIFNLIKKVRVGKMCTNRYYLVDEKYWRRDTDLLARQLLAAMLAAKHPIPTALKNRLSEVMGTEYASLEKEVMGTEYASVMRTGVPMGVYSSSLTCALEFTSNSKDTQSKDTKDKQRSKRSIKKVTKGNTETENPSATKAKAKPQYRDEFDPVRNTMVRTYL